ncbi:MAG: NUDIX hydrolase [Patescibacteria group bacterium]
MPSSMQRTAQPRAKVSSSSSSLSKKFSLRHVFRVGAIVWCKHKGRDYYVVMKSFTRPNRGTQIPGGRIERDENPAAAVIREVIEETGVETRIICPLGLIFFENPEDNYSNLQLYYIVRPLYPINVFKRWQVIDQDQTKQELECWCMSTNNPTSYLAVGQGKIVDMFKVWLKEHKKPNNSNQSFQIKN